MNNNYFCIGSSIQCNSAMNDILTSNTIVNKLKVFIVSIISNCLVNVSIMRLTINNNCVLLNCKRNINLDTKSDEDKYSLEHDCNELYFNNRILIKNINMAVPILLTIIKKKLLRKTKNKRLVITLSIDFGEYPGITIHFYTFRENIIYLANIERFEQPVLQMIC